VHFDPLEFVDAVLPWAAFAVMAVYLYKGARVYLNTRRITSRVCGLLAYALGWMSLGITHYHQAFSRSQRIAVGVIGVGGFLVAGILISYWAKPPQPNRPT